MSETAQAALVACLVHMKHLHMKCQKVSLIDVSTAVSIHGLEIVLAFLVTPVLVPVIQKSADYLTLFGGELPIPVHFEASEDFFHFFGTLGYPGITSSAI